MKKVPTKRANKAPKSRKVVTPKRPSGLMGSYKKV